MWVVDAFAVDFELREEDLRDDAAEFARAGGEAYARCAEFRREDFGRYLREVVRCQFACIFMKRIVLTTKVDVFGPKSKNRLAMQ